MKTGRQWIGVLPFLLFVILVQAQETYRGIRIAPEYRCSPYDPADCAYPQSVETRLVDEYGGLVYSPYTGRCFDHRGQTDIGHVVARSEAPDSGLCAADAATRRAFSRDLLNWALMDTGHERLLVRRTGPGGPAQVRADDRPGGGRGRGEAAGRLCIHGNCGRLPGRDGQCAGTVGGHAGRYSTVALG